MSRLMLAGVIVASFASMATCTRSPAHALPANTDHVFVCGRQLDGGKPHRYVHGWYRRWRGQHHLYDRRADVANRVAGSPSLQLRGNMANSLSIDMDRVSAGQSISTTIAFSKPVNKLRFITGDVDGDPNGGGQQWEDRLVYTGLNGATAANPTLAGNGAIHTIAGNTVTATSLTGVIPTTPLVMSRRILPIRSIRPACRSSPVPTLRRRRSNTSDSINSVFVS